MSTDTVVFSVQNQGVSLAVFDTFPNKDVVENLVIDVPEE